MVIEESKREAMQRAVSRLIRKNTGTLQVLSAALAGMFNGGANRHLAARIFGFDPRTGDSLDTLILESLLNGLEAEDIEEIVRRYALRRGLQY